MCKTHFYLHFFGVVFAVEEKLCLMLSRPIVACPSSANGDAAKRRWLFKVQNIVFVLNNNVSNDM